MALWPVTEAAALERRARVAAGDLAGRAALAFVDAVVASSYTERAVDHVLDSPLAEHAIGHAVSGPLVKATARDVALHAERILEDPEFERIAARVSESPTVERLVTRIAESPAIERTVGQVMDSRLLDQVVARLLESEELWLLVDEIAQSPAVTEAIAQQGLGFANEVADQVNQRTRRADAITERIARRLLHRHARVEPPPPAVDTP
jgi:hypothetical protein